MRDQVDLYRLRRSAEDESRGVLKNNGLNERKEEPDEEELRVDELLSMDKMNISKCHDNIEPPTPSNNVCCADIGEEEGGDDEATKVVTEKGTIDLCDFEDL